MCVFIYRSDNFTQTSTIFRVYVGAILTRERLLYVCIHFSMAYGESSGLDICWSLCNWYKSCQHTYACTHNESRTDRWRTPFMTSTGKATPNHTLEMYLDTVSHCCLLRPWTSVTHLSRMLINMQANPHVHTQILTLFLCDTLLTHAHFFSKFGQCVTDSVFLLLRLSTHLPQPSRQGSAVVCLLVFISVFVTLG